MAAFSSRGPTDDGRIKPDVVAPGTWVLSGYSSLYQRGYGGSVDPLGGLYQYDGWGTPLSANYKHMGGTSMSNPLTAGAAAVVRDYYFKAQGGHNASAALVKATLINSAVDMFDENNDGVDDNAFPIPNLHEGWGRVDLANATDGSHEFVDDTTGTTTGATATHGFQAAGGPFKVTLVWSDYPSTAAAAANLVNDLDLVVTAPGGSTSYRGNVMAGGWAQTGGGADRVNNVENVYVQSAAAGGVWTVEIHGFNVPNGPQPYAQVVDGTASAPTADTTPPVVTPPADVTAEARGPLTAVSLGMASATDAVDGPLTATPSQTGPFPVGTTVVTWSATDAAGNIGSASQNVIVTDTTGPTVTAPADVTAEATGPLTEVTLGTASATDAVDGSLTPTPDKSGPFPVGNTVVTWTATDSDGNTGSAIQNVTVTDTTDPTVTAPADVTAEATGTLTAVSLGTASATDAVDSSLTPTPDNTGPFPVGTTTVTWTATDAAGNTGSATQIVTILEPAPPNQPPVAADDTFATSKNTTLTVPAAGVLGNDSDADGDALGAALQSDVTNGTLTLSADGGFIYTPNKRFTGSDGFTYIASDGNGGSDTATVAITVSGGGGKSGGGNGKGGGKKK